MSIVVRALNSQDEFHDAVELQKEIWQFKDMDLLPRRLFVVATKVGGQAFGAYDGERMVGFALAIPGMKQGYGGYLHSHMVGVAASHRNQRRGAHAEAGAARRCAGARRRSDGVDVRSA